MSAQGSAGEGSDMASAEELPAGMDLSGGDEEVETEMSVASSTQRRHIIHMPATRQPQASTKLCWLHNSIVNIRSSS